MGNLMEAFLAIMGLVSGFYALALMLGQSGPSVTQHETVSPEQSHAIHPPTERLAA
jgi:hypothetical protein